ncbi:MAG: hypothetical protein CMM77_14760 [Rhodospirillaceae bacterium]|nr:hypothetical protein [Magnetovibrio sp.]MAY68372.1 hypothetical protein [Rhodospirillaceae bacterium]
MTDVSKVGGVTSQFVNRPIPPSKSTEKSAATGDDAKAGEAKGAPATFNLPSAISGGETKEVSAAEALETVFASLSKAFSEAEDTPPGSGAALEALLSDLKVAAPFLDRVLAARKSELTAAGDTEGLKTLDSTLAEAEATLADARTQLEGVAGDVPDEEVVEDPAVTAALNAILGEGRDIPAFSADEVHEGRKEFVALVFDDIADSIGRHRNTGLQTASYTLNALGGANLTA